MHVQIVKQKNVNGKAEIIELWKKHFTRKLNEKTYSYRSIETINQSCKCFNIYQKKYICAIISEKS